ncbi:MAG: GNAT family N-acetyltransferase [Patescibacteria group bacterium]
MEIIDLAPGHESLYFVCLEDWSEEIREAGGHKEAWYNEHKGRGLRVKLARDDKGEIGGMIQYLPIEQTHVSGRGLYFIPCIWVHGHKQGRGDFRGRGMGGALLHAAEEDARALGAEGMAAWGLALPVFMRASWFRRHGYAVADRDGMAVLLWKPFVQGAAQPKWVKRRKKPAAEPGVVTVSAFINGWCPAQNMVFERARRAAAELGERVRFQAYRTSDPAVFAEWGIADGLYVDGRPVRTGPPPSYEKIRGIIAKRLRALK